MPSSRTPVRRHTHIAMVGVPLISHTLPSLAIIRELVARGHRVTYANDPYMAEVLAPTGARLVAYDSALPFTDNQWPEDPVAAMDLFLEDAVQALPQLRAVYEEDRPDLYLYDIGGYAARALAEEQGVPAVQLSPTYVSWEGAEDSVGTAVRQLPGADEHFGKFARWLETCGARTTDVGEFSAKPRRALAMIPRAMQPHADLVDEEAVSFVGPCFGDRGEQSGTWQRPPGDGKLLLVSLGSSYTHLPGFYRQCLEAFGGLPGWHVVLQIGKHTDPAELGEIPANVEVLPWVPQLAILEQADAFVTHAGMGGSSEGLFTGTPMIAVPQSAEQPANADRLVELGVARRIDTADATAAALRTALLELTADGEVARRLAQLRQQVRAEGGSGRAADLVEEMLP